MAKGFADTESLCRELLADIRKKIFRPVYLLMGEEPFYPDMVCDAIIRNALDESERDFNQSIYYGADVNADTVITAARRYPVFAERQLVVVKEAQMMKSLEELSLYCAKPLDSTVLVICMHGASATSMTKTRKFPAALLRRGVKRSCLRKARSPTSSWWYRNDG